MPNPTQRLAVFFDGTDNKPKDRTNVWRVHELVAAADALGVPQLKRYIQGVGTEIGEIAAGSIFGSGVSERIREGYHWLVKNYQDGAEIYVFGFSRGAFSARSLVQMIATCGLTRPEALGEWDVDQAFERYESIASQESEEVRPVWRLRYWQRHPEEAPPGWQPTPEDLRLMDEAKVRVVKVRMAGLWDTVGALGTTALKNPEASTQKAASHNVRPTKAQEHGYHALAIDEHRPMFQDTLWRVFVEQGQEEAAMARYAPYYEQRWFVGAHSDVGGGYRDDRLPDLSLSWMLEKARGLGLDFTHAIEPQAGSWHAPIHDSFKAFAGGVLSIWDKFIPGDQRFYREIGRAPKAVRTGRGTEGLLWSIHETIDPSVLRRWMEDPTYRPPSLLEYFGRHPEQIPGGAPARQRTQRVYTSKYWNETGVLLRPNATYKLRVVPGLGEPLRDAEFTARSIEGEDWNSFAHKAASLVHGKRKDDAKWFALIGTVDKAHPWVIQDGGLFSVPVGGQLLCYFNDVQIEWFYENNSGWVVLEIEQV